VSDGWDEEDETNMSPPDLYTGESPLQSAHKVWAKVQNDLAYALGANVHRSWTARLRISDACPHTITLSAPSRFVANKIENTYMETIKRLWNKHDVVLPPRKSIISAPVSNSKPQKYTLNQGRGPNKAKINAKRGLYSAYQDNSRLSGRYGSPLKGNDKGSKENANTEKGLGATGTGATGSQPYSHTPHYAGSKAQGNSLEMTRGRFTFNNFVVGPSNELAHAVARQISSENEPSYNPIVIHGQNGMGKTHLLYAIKHKLEEENPGRRVQFLSSEKFVSNFVRSVRKGGRDEIEQFKSSLRDVDLLIIDDAHFIADKPNSQEELLHTLISLVGAGRQILLASDRHPDHIEKASDRLKSYLAGGLVCKLGAADYELRLRILDRLIARRKAGGNSNLAIPKNARDLLAAKINATPRDLEGAFNQVVAQAEFLGLPITLESVQETLSDSRYAAGQRLTVDKIQRITAEEFGITLDDMTSKRRSRNIARPRQVAMYFCKTLTKRSLPDIGRRFGGRDHTTVMHAVKRITSLRKEDEAFNVQVQNVEDRLNF